MADTSGIEGLLDKFTAEGDMWWCLLGIDPATANGAKPKIVLQAEGDSNVENMKSYLADYALQYGCMKVLGVDTKGAVVSTRMKLVFFQWVGPTVPRMKVSKALSTKSALLSFFQGHHLALEIYDKASLNEHDIEARLRAAGGAHQPSEMKFGSGSTVKTHALPSEHEDASSSVSTPASSSSSVSATPVKAAPAAAAAPAPAAVTKAEPITSPAAAVAKVTHATPAKAKEEATAAVTAIGKAASALRELLASGKPVPADALHQFVEGPLGAAAVKAAAVLSTVSDFGSNV